MHWEFKINIELFQRWKEKLIAKVHEKIAKLQQKVKLRVVKSVPNDPDVQRITG